MREMIQTERDYVLSLQYIIENYIPELQREDVPQALRGKGNIIFGNLEKIFQFHRQYFLREVEMCERNPFQIAHYFLMHVSMSWSKMSYLNVITLFIDIFLWGFVNSMLKFISHEPRKKDTHSLLSLHNAGATRCGGDIVTLLWFRVSVRAWTL